MITSDTMYNVKNRSSSVVVYRIPETNLRREFQPGETKKIPFGELEKLTYQPGGHEGPGGCIPLKRARGGARRAGDVFYSIPARSCG